MGEAMGEPVGEPVGEPALVEPEVLGRARAMAARFPPCAPVHHIAPLGRGLINATFAVECARGQFVLQRINGAVFPDPRLIMENLMRLQQAAAQAGQAAPRLPRFHATDEGLSWVQDGDGAYWRLLERVPAALTLPRVADTGQAQAIGALLGQFHRFGASLAIADFHVTLPRSHDTLGYRAALDEAIAQAPREVLDAQVDALLGQVRARDALLPCLVDALKAGALRKTLIHGDPKRDNVLFDLTGRRALCLIDLDTVQPGLILHDLGDCLRSCCNRAGERALPQDVSFDAGLAEALLAGYSRTAPDLLCATELELLFEAMRLIPLELGIRFLVDHLRGDCYFRVSYRGENLRKAAAQLALVADIERQESRLRRLGRDIFGA
jgi:Ser/Thr protein kinase RdoA (MazF antagonist)